MSRLLARMVAHNVTSTAAYRAAFFVMMITTIIQPIISLLVLLTVQAEGAQLPFDRSQLVSYYLLLGLVSMLTASWAGYYVAEGIRDGDVTDYLLRPAPYSLHYIANNLGEKVIKLPLMLPLIVLVGLLFRADLRLPSDPLIWVFFVVAVVCAATTAFLLDFVIGSLAFWITDVSGLFRLRTLVSGLLAGQFLPLAFFPPAFTGFLEAQPFRYTLSFPLELLSGSLGPDAIRRGFLWQVGYCIALWASYRLLWRYGLRSYEAVGR
jgi:ABC-2 type transport system permease protein